MLYGKRDFVGMIKFRLFRWGDYPGLLKRASNVICLRSPLQKEAEGDLTTEERKWDVITQAGGEKAI